MPDDLNRRRAALGIGAAGLVLAARPLHAAAPIATDRLRMFMQMRGALDERLVIGCLSGRYHGVVDGELTPLYGVVSATFARYRARPEGGYLVTSFEQAYYTDLDSGAVLTQWRNPYHGRTVSVPVWSSPPARRVLWPDLRFTALQTMPGVHYDHAVLPMEWLGDELVFVERVSFSSAAPRLRYSELVTLRASATALAVRDAVRVPCSTGFTAVVSWRPWLQMGDQPGHLLAHGAGSYGVPLEALPPAWLEATRRLRPELSSDPGRILDAPAPVSP